MRALRVGHEDLQSVKWHLHQIRNSSYRSSTSVRVSPTWWPSAASPYTADEAHVPFGAPARSRPGREPFRRREPHRRKAPWGAAARHEGVCSSRTGRAGRGGRRQAAGHQRSHGLLERIRKRDCATPRGERLRVGELGSAAGSCGCRVGVDLGVSCGRKGGEAYGATNGSSTPFAVWAAHPERLRASRI